MTLYHHNKANMKNNIKDKKLEIMIRFRRNNINNKIKNKNSNSKVVDIINKNRSSTINMMNIINQENMMIIRA